MGSGGLLLEPPCNGLGGVVYCSYQGDSNMKTPHNPRATAAGDAWMAALDRLKAAEAEVLRARGALNAALAAYIQAGDALAGACRDEPPACNLPGSVV